MRVLIPFAIGDSNLTASNLAENDYGAWDAGTAYVADDYVISTTSHSVYVCIAPTTGDDPDADAGNTYWLRVGATNRWKAFDQLISDPAVGVASGTITYTLGALGVPANAVTCFGLAGTSISLVVTDAVDGEVYSETVSLIDTSLINDAFAYCFEPSRVKTEAVFADIPPYAQAEFAIVLAASAGNVPQLGQIAIGQEYILGVTNFGTNVSIEDYSIKDTDDWGNHIIVERPFAKLIDFDFVTLTAQARRTALLLETVRARPAVYFADTGTEQFGTTFYVFFKNWNITLQATYSPVTLEVEGLT